MDEVYSVVVEGLTVAYDDKPVLKDISLGIPKGRLTAVIGPNGAGKTTLIRAIMGLIKPVAGRVLFPGLPTRERRIGYVPQSGSVDWDFPATALDIVTMGCYGKLGWIRRPGASETRLAREMLDRVGMLGFQSRQIGQLSGGQQQRVFLARALAQEADIYFMDEPFKGVDAQTEREIVRLLKELQTCGKTVVVVHHDLHTAPEYFDWVTIVNLRLIANGPVAEAFTEANLHKAYDMSDKMIKCVV